MRRFQSRVFLTFILVSFVFLAGCKKDEVKIPQDQIEQSAQADDFSDLKAQEGGCKTEEDLKKKIEEEARAKKPSKLQGGNTDCVVK
ncbi:MAG: hypothetical protein A2X86_06350 [Bdellovibrionales bacterium GWA2_49_15]|nr:MAG: hypothetical protein A2X86_06350 [Bdellovibrionales bacterium GWA2_49_15]HAZ12107.1 hypothetical protein [Bdellovibrionales bacterium]